MAMIVRHEKQYCEHHLWWNSLSYAAHQKSVDGIVKYCSIGSKVNMVLAITQICSEPYISDTHRLVEWFNTQ